MFVDKFRSILALLALIILFAAPAAAETISVTIPLAGHSLTYGDEDISTPFDLGVQFSRIDSIAVQVIGQGVDGVLRIIDGSQTTEQAFAPPLAVFLPGGSGTPPGNGGELQRGEQLTWDVDFGPPASLILTDYFDHLLDGAGELRLSSRDNFFTIGFTRIEIPQPSHIDLTSARISFTGAVVPEPSGAALALLGMLSLLFSVRHARAVRRAPRRARAGSRLCSWR
jgi:hypothetical protein